jgi:hypothetical protein
MIAYDRHSLVDGWMESSILDTITLTLRYLATVPVQLRSLR